MQQNFHTNTTDNEPKVNRDFSGIELYNHLTVYGSHYKTRHVLKDPEKYVNWTEENFTYVKYNPRKNVNRYGLSLTSLDGGMSGVPDLDSLIEYKRITGIQYYEQHFKTKTPAYYYPDLESLLKPIEDDIMRSHILKLGPGGFFPPHRDYFGLYFDNFRAIIPLKNMNPPSHNFILEDKGLTWDMGKLYFLDTAKMHYVFNASMQDMYMIVLNIELNERTVKFITEHMEYK